MNGDFGNAWLKTGYAGSGVYKLREWRANEAVVMERNDNYYGEKAKLARVIYRNMKESSGQRLALEAGDIERCHPTSSRTISTPLPRTPTSPPPVRQRARSITSASTRRIRTSPNPRSARLSNIWSTTMR